MYFQVLPDLLKNPSHTCQKNFSLMPFVFPLLLYSVPTLNGKNLDVMVAGMNVMINDAKVLITDIVGSNGVIHVVDTVILP